MALFPGIVSAPAREIDRVTYRNILVAGAQVLLIQNAKRRRGTEQLTRWEADVLDIASNRQVSVDLLPMHTAITTMAAAIGLHIRRQHVSATSHHFVMHIDGVVERPAARNEPVKAVCAFRLPDAASLGVIRPNDLLQQPITSTHNAMPTVQSSVSFCLAWGSLPAPLYSTPLCAHAHLCAWPDSDLDRSAPKSLCDLTEEMCCGDYLVLHRSGMRADSAGGQEDVLTRAPEVTGWVQAATFHAASGRTEVFELRFTVACASDGGVYGAGAVMALERAVFIAAFVSIETSCLQFLPVWHLPSQVLLTLVDVSDHVPRSVVGVHAQDEDAEMPSRTSVSLAVHPSRACFAVGLHEHGSTYQVVLNVDINGSTDPGSVFGSGCAAT
jgi:hypothetical protein